ncbi:MFS transporter [Paraburkholderia dipogonis]|uniref:MFS transporter n=1 Tax=Paraburkholderia dipogonis TaxID=1211383 RepID=A0A4Y8MK23_9BURK|nr:MFS transporter [Paraburkholderia dipogonis]TFE37830.1 MFS transporter [Paraburkholderia dipogonis]
MLEHSKLDVPRRRWYVVGTLLFLIYMICFADRSNIGVAAPEMVRDLHLSGAVTGTLLSAFFWGYVLTQLPGGWLANTIGPKRVIVGALCVVGVTGCMTGFVDHLPFLIGVRFVMGLGEGVIWPSFAIMFLNWFPQSERGRAVSLSQYTLPLSSVIMAPLAGWMIREFHWRIMFVMQGIPALILAVVVWAIVTEDPVEDKSLSPAERDYIVAHRGGEDVESRPFSEVFRSPIVWGLCLTYFLWVTGLYAFGMWVPTVVKQLSADMGMDTVGWLTAIPYAFATLGMYLVARAADRSNLSRGWYVAGALGLAGFALLAQHFMAGALTTNMVMLTLAGVGIFSALGAWWSWALAIVPRNQAAPAVGLVNLCGNAGGICGPLVVGFAANGGKASDGFFLIGFALLLGSLFAVLLAVKNPETLPVKVSHVLH